MLRTASQTHSAEDALNLNDSKILLRSWQPGKWENVEKSRRGAGGDRISTLATRWRVSAPHATEVPPGFIVLRRHVFPPSKNQFRSTAAMCRGHRGLSQKKSHFAVFAFRSFWVFLFWFCMEYVAKQPMKT